MTLRASRAPCFLPIYSLLPHKGISITLLLFFSFYLFYMHLVCFLLITINRFTFIVFPSKAVRVRVTKNVSGSYLDLLKITLNFLNFYLLDMANNNHDTSFYNFDTPLFIFLAYYVKQAQIDTNITRLLIGWIYVSSDRKTFRRKSYNWPKIFCPKNPH